MELTEKEAVVMAKNRNLNDAAKAKKDEFYTQLTDIESELNHDEYRKFFKGKSVYCNCDDYRYSQFSRYFADNFETLGLNKLTATSYAEQGNFAVITRGGRENGLLQGNGDFRSAECIEILKQADVVVTNPPFSLFREYVAQLMQFKKSFVILGNKNAITYKEIFPLIQQNKMWAGYTKWAGGLWFVSAVPEVFDKEVDGVKLKNTAAIWFTNIPLKNFKKNYFWCRNIRPKNIRAMIITTQ